MAEICKSLANLWWTQLVVIAELLGLPHRAQGLQACCSSASMSEAFQLRLLSD